MLLSQGIQDELELKIHILLKGKAFLEVPFFENPHMGHHNNIVGREINIYILEEISCDTFFDNLAKDFCHLYFKPHDFRLSGPV